MTTGYSLFLDLLRDYFAWRPEEGEAERAARLVAALQDLVERGDLTAERAEEIAPLLGNLLSLRSGTDWDLRLKNAAPEQIRHQTLLALQDLFVALAHRQPLVLILEDLHWADSLSLDGISLLLEALPQAPLLLLCVYRPEREHRCWQLATLASRKCPESYTEITLRELPPPQSCRLMQALLGSDMVPPTVTEVILQQAQGNPFFVEEVVHSFLEMGALYRDGETWRLREKQDRATVPGSVQSVILSRLDSVRPETRQVLVSAAVMGRLFRRRLLEQIVGPETALETALWELEDRGLIYQERVVPEAEYSFKHVLTQETIYVGLLRGQRELLHREAGEAIEALHSDELEEHYEELAYHYGRSSADEKAVEYLGKAGEKASRAYLNEEAVAYFTRTLERVDRLALGQARNVPRLAGLKGIAQALLAMGKVSEAEQYFRQGIAVGQEIGMSASELVPLYHGLAEALWWQARYGEVIRVGEQGLALSGEDAQTVEAALMIDAIAMGYGSEGDGDKWREYIYRNARFIDRLPYSRELRGAFGHVHYVYAADGDVEAATRWLHLFEAKAQQHQDLTGLGEMRRYAGELMMGQGDLSGGVAQLQQALELMHRIGDSRHEEMYLVTLGQAFLSLGSLGKAEEFAKAGLQLGEGRDDKMGIAHASMSMATLLLCQGSLAEALTACERSVQLFRQVGDPGGEASARLRQGRLHLFEGNRAGALKLFQTAVATARPGAALLFSALSGLEEAYGDPEAFRGFCRHLREEHPEGTAAPSARWFLEPTEARAFSQLVVHDAFSAPLASVWGWEDPFGDCSFATRDALEIFAVNGRDLRHTNLSAPRLLQPVQGSFAAQTACSLVSEERPALGGILFWKDEQNYLRLERGTRGKPEISFQGCIGGSDRMLGRGRLPGERIVLRLEKLGRRVKALCSPDGHAWFIVGQVELPTEDAHTPSTGARVGLHAIGSIDRVLYPAAFPEGTAIRFESFDLWV